MYARRRSKIEPDFLAHPRGIFKSPEDTNHAHSFRALQILLQPAQLHHGVHRRGTRLRIYAPSLLILTLRLTGTIRARIAGLQERKVPARKPAGAALAERL